MLADAAERSGDVRRDVYVRAALWMLSAAMCNGKSANLLVAPQSLATVSGWAVWYGGTCPAAGIQVLFSCHS